DGDRVRNLAMPEVAFDPARRETQTRTARLRGKENAIGQRLSPPAVDPVEMKAVAVYRFGGYHAADVCRIRRNDHKCPRGTAELPPTDLHMTETGGEDDQLMIVETP